MACCPWRAVTVVLGGILIHLTLGTVYSFGNLTPYLTSYLRNSTSRHDLTYSDSVWILACALMGQGVAIFLAGFIGRKLGTRITTLIGCWIMSAGVALTYFTVRHSYIGVIFTYGVITGLGVGVGYPMPLACAMKWMPERKGLAGGLVVAGFGGGAFIFNFIQTAFINPWNHSPDMDVNGEKFFTQPELLERVPWVFLLTGGIYATMQLIGVLILRDPTPENTTYDLNMKDTNGDIMMTSITPTDTTVTVTKLSDVTDNKDVIASQEDVHSESAHVTPEKVGEIEGKTDVEDEVVRYSSHNDEDLTPLQVLKTRAFYTLWFCFLINGQGIVFLSSLYKDYGQTYIKDDVFLATAGAFAAVFNFSGRMFWGYIADRFSFKTAMLCLCTAFFCLMITFDAVGVGGKPVFFIYVCLLFGTFSGNYPLMSLASAQAFGQTHYAMNFGLVFTAQTITAPIGAILSSQLKTQIGWFGMFSLIAAFSFLSLILIATFPHKKRKDLHE